MNSPAAIYRIVRAWLRRNRERGTSTLTPQLTVGSAATSPPPTRSPATGRNIISGY